MWRVTETRPIVWESTKSRLYNLTVRLTTNHSPFPSPLSFVFHTVGSPGEGEDGVKRCAIIFVLKKVRQTI